jgi:ribonuclease PH
MRVDGRKQSDLRKINVTPGYLSHPEGCVLMEMGGTRVICAASIVGSVPPWLEGKGQGWVTAEYAMLPRANKSRKNRESQGRISGRTQEIQRLIGRSLRAVCDLKKLADKTIYLDCDVIEADGGTRTASITGAYIALELACRKLISEGKLAANPIREQVAAISVGMKGGDCLLDLNYPEDSSCDVDMNVVMTGAGDFIEIQGTAEGQTFSRDDQLKMLDVAWDGIQQLLKVQRQIIEQGS